jgi:hypothetical protein
MADTTGCEILYRFIFLENQAHVNFRIQSGLFEIKCVVRFIASYFGTCIDVYSHFSTISIYALTMYSAIKRRPPQHPIHHHQQS